MQKLIFLHGFLGVKEDWERVIAQFENEFDCLAIDLEHPLSESVLKNLNSQEKYHLIGYSMGGRLALQLKEKYPDRFYGPIVFSAHPGLKCEEEKRLRKEQDEAWATMIETLPFPEFLKRWYAQPLFDHLRKRDALYKDVLARRLKGDTAKFAALLRTFSLAYQPYHIPEETSFIFGKEDLKYATLYRTLPPHINVYTVEGCGHSVHLEDPVRCACLIREIIHVTLERS